MNRETKLKKLVEPCVEALIVGILFCSTRILPCRKGFDEQNFRYVLEATNLGVFLYRPYLQNFST